MGLVLGNVRYVFWFHHKKGIGADCVCLVIALTHAAEILPECCHPNFSSCWVLHEFAIARYVFAGDQVDHGHAIVFEILDGVVFAKVEGGEGIWS